MTSRTLNRSLIIHKDLALGYGTTLQTRGISPETAEQKIELDFIFRDVNEIRYLDTNRYTRASLHTNGPLTHYVFDPISAGIDDGNTILAPIPVIAVGRWIRVTSNSASLNYETVADLIADIAIIATIAPNTQVTVSGYHTAGDFGGGAFYWDAYSTETHDGGMVLTPTGHTDPGRWIRIISTLLSVHHFGAVGDGITNDRTAIEASLTASATYKLTVAFRDLTYDVAGFDLTITDNIRILGTGWPILLNGIQLTLACNSVSIINFGIVDWTEGVNLEPQSGTGTGVATYNFEQFNAVRCAHGMKCIDANAIVETLRIRGGYFNGSNLRHAYYFVGKVEVADIENLKLEAIGSIANNDITVGIGLGVLSRDCDTVIIRNCEISDLTAALDIKCCAFEIIGDRITITDNIIKNINGTGATKKAIYTAGTNCIVTNNSITNGGESAGEGWITCESDGDDNNFIVANNVLDGETGITGTFMYLAGIGTVNGNRMSGDAIARGITLVGQPTHKQFHITSNYIDCPAAFYGIYAVELVNSVIDDNHIIADGNAIESAAPLATYAIQDTIISNNYLEGDKGILFTEAQNIRLDNNIFNTVTAEIGGNYKYGWWFIDGVMTTTSAKLLSVIDIVNTMPYKQLGITIWDETLNQPMHAIGPLDADAWVDSAGLVVHVPI